MRLIVPLTVLGLVGCGTGDPCPPVKPDRNTENRVRDWLRMNSYSMVVNHFDANTSPIMDWDDWIAKGGEIHDIEPVLRSLLSKQDCDVELPLVAQSLGVLGNSESVPVLIDSLNTDDLHLRLQAAAALGELRDERAIRPLGRLLTIEDDENVRANIVIALTSIGGPDAESYLQAATGDPSCFVADLARAGLAEAHRKRP